MGLKDDVINKVSAIINQPFDVTDVSYVPRLDDPRLTFGNTGLKFQTTTLFVDMRGSTKMLNKHNKSTVAKLHMAYFHAIVKIANANNGHVRSFNGDSALVFFPGATKRAVSDAVMTAMKIKYMLADSNSGINSILSKYSEINFGIGVDYGDVLCTKVGVGGEYNRDLFWIGNCVNKSTVLGNLTKSPNHIGISGCVYDNLSDEVKYKVREGFFGYNERIDMWSSGCFEYNGSIERYCHTNWHFTV